MDIPFGNSDGTFVHGAVLPHSGVGHVVLEDLDLDGDMDVVISINRRADDDDWERAAVYVNDGTGTFNLPGVFLVGANAMGLALGDVLGGDGFPEILVASYGLEAVTVLKN